MHGNRIFCPREYCTIFYVVDKSSLEQTSPPNQLFLLGVFPRPILDLPPLVNVFLHKKLNRVSWLALKEIYSPLSSSWGWKNKALLPYTFSAILDAAFSQWSWAALSFDLGSDFIPYTPIQLQSVGFLQIALLTSSVCLCYTPSQMPRCSSSLHITVWKKKHCSFQVWSSVVLPCRRQTTNSTDFKDQRPQAICHTEQPCLPMLD